MFYDAHTINQELLSFIDESPVSFFAVRNMSRRLEEAGFTRLLETESWQLQPGRAYYVTRNDSAIIAFRLPEGAPTGFQIMASHADSPVFRIKTNAEITVNNAYVKLNVERYGGMLCAPWMDRPLSVAGRVMVQEDGATKTRLVNIDRDLLMIPNLAIHMDRTANDGHKFNAQVDMLPLLAQVSDAKDRFLSLIAQAAGTSSENILDTDLYLYNRMKGTFYGIDNEFIADSQLDDLQCAFSSLRGILDAAPSSAVAMHCVFDNEEVGSGTKQGADGTFLQDTMARIREALGIGRQAFLSLLASSFMVSADNAHSVHPNFPDKADPTNRPVMNKGIVIKYSANQKYTTDAVSGALMRMICRKAGVPYQTFANRSDLAGGSTLGNISQSHVSVNTVDIGLPQLAMHSPYETAGAKDTAYLAEAARVFFSSAVKADGRGNYQLL